MLELWEDRSHVQGVHQAPPQVTALYLQVPHSHFIENTLMYGNLGMGTRTRPGPGAKDQDEEEGLPSAELSENTRDEKSGLSEFWRFCVVMGPLSRNLTSYDSHCNFNLDLARRTWHLATNTEYHAKSPTTSRVRTEELGGIRAVGNSPGPGR